MSNFRIIRLHLTDGITALGSHKTLGLEHVQPGKTPADSIKRITGGYLVGFQKRLFVVPDSRVDAAEVEDLDAGPAEDAPVVPPPMQITAAPTAPQLSDHELSARAAAEARKLLAAERVKAKPGSAEATERAAKEAK